MRTVAAVFPTLADAGHVAQHLEKLGVAPEDVNIIAGNAQGQHDEFMKDYKLEHKETASAAVDGARYGGGIGILASLAALAIPGVGPFIAGGALATVIAGLGVGAAAGGVLGALTTMGISHDDARLYERAVTEGGVFVSVHCNDPMEPEVMRLLAEHGARDLHEENSGAEHPYPSDSAVRSYGYTRE